MVHTADLTKPHQLRLLQVDNLVCIVVDSPVRVLVTSADVLHSWAVPAFGVKMDCVCGRLNQFFLYADKPGVYYGQCSELCGENHGFMPIMVQVVSIPFYIEWLTKLFIKLNS
jgi:cytochrome c oxidase subunit 2